MDRESLKQLIKKPLLERLKYLGEGLKVGVVSPGRVMVKPVKPETSMDRLEQSRLLYIPDGLKAQYTPPASTGIVVQLGKDIEFWEVGDMVMFGSMSGNRYTVDGQEIFILDESEIMCSLEPTEGSTVEVAPEREV